MYALYRRYYLSTSPEQFQRDLAAKDRAVLLHDEKERLCGFSTLAVEDLEIGGGPIRVIFSGDTIIDRLSWGSQRFAFTWIREIGRIASAAPDLPLYWLLIVKGHRTYRYLPAFGIDFVPDWRRPERRDLDDLKDVIAARMFGHAYDPETGIVTFPRSRGHLAPRWAKVTPREARRADVGFFLKRNPGYAKGTELVCLCELSEANMRPLTRRIFRQGFSSCPVGTH